MKKCKTPGIVPAHGGRHSTRWLCPAHGVWRITVQWPGSSRAVQAGNRGGANIQNIHVREGISDMHIYIYTYIYIEIELLRYVIWYIRKQHTLVHFQNINRNNRYHQHPYLQASRSTKLLDRPKTSSRPLMPSLTLGEGKTMEKPWDSAVIGSF